MKTAQNKPLSKQEEFEKAAKPLMEFLHDTPHMSVMVTSTYAELMEGQMICRNTQIKPSFEKAFQQLGESPYVEGSGLPFSESGLFRIFFQNKGYDKWCYIDCATSDLQETVSGLRENNAVHNIRVSSEPVL